MYQSIPITNISDPGGFAPTFGPATGDFYRQNCPGVSPVVGPIIYYDMALIRADFPAIWLANSRSV